MIWKPGDRVIVRSAQWRAVRATRFATCEALDVIDVQSARARTFLLPFDRPRAPVTARPRVVSRRRWAHEVASLVRDTFPYGGVRFCPSAIRLLAYQFEPALAMLRHGALRLLVADDVGLGKTVEAGLVVREFARGDSFARILVLCPAGLRAQWARELARLFDVHPIEADALWLHRSARDLPPYVNPWSIPGTYLASIDFVKRAEALRPLEDVRWDLLVVDEAHTATPGSDRRAALEALAGRSTRLILLTATPHSGDDGQFRALCGTGGDPGPVVLFCRSREDARLDTLPTRSVVLPVRLSPAERRTHRLLEAYTGRISREGIGRRGPGADLVATVLRKRALSCPTVLARSVRRRLELLSDAPAAPAQLPLPLLPEQDLADAEPLAGLGMPGLQDEEEERRILRSIAEAAEQAARDERKLKALLRFLRRAREPAIVFSEYRDTATHLERVLAVHGHRVILLHGGLTEEERGQAVDAFSAGDSLLVATDAASEGLNLHYNCRLIIHFELPWTPARLYQRCGRVRRIGQKRRVHEMALVGNHTAEHLVIAPLLARAARSGPLSRTALLARLTESRVAAHVLAGTRIEPAAAVAFDSALVTSMDLRAEAEAEVRRLEMLRHLDGARPPVRRGERASRAGVPIVFLRRRHEPVRPHLLILFGLSLRDTRGNRLEEDLLPLRIRLGPGAEPWATRPSALRRQVAWLVESLEPHLAAVLEPRLSARLAAIRPMRSAAREALRRHAASLEARIRPVARELVQAGLFDRRALRASRTRMRAGNILLEEEGARGGAVVLDGPACETAPGEATTAACEVRAVLVGAWP